MRFYADILSKFVPCIIMKDERVMRLPTFKLL